MISLYRCPKCDSVLERQTEFDDLVRTLPKEKPVRTGCPICGQIFSVRDILTGCFDVIKPESNADSKSTDNIYELGDVLSLLEREHNDSYVYRGQTKEYSGPLVPSLYRELVDSNQYDGWSGASRLRGVGSVFHELAVTPNVINPKKLAEISIVRYLRYLFGYPLSQLLAQQTGLTSEGLDVTSNLNIAAFFAAYDFQSNRFVNDGSVGIIYRFRVEPSSHSIDDFKGYDFYNCPSFLQPNVSKLFGLCKSLEESYESFWEYCLCYQMNVATEGIRNRPLELIQLPFDALEQSRLVQQAAGLLVPDMILSKDYAAFDRSPPIGKAKKDGLNAIEDLSQREGTDRFYFRHSDNSKRYIRSGPLQVFPKTDALTEMLSRFLSESMLQLNFLTEAGIVGNPFALLTPLEQKK